AHPLFEICKTQPVLQCGIVRPARHSFGSESNRLRQSSRLQIAEHEAAIDGKVLRGNLRGLLVRGNCSGEIVGVERSLTLLQKALQVRISRLRRSPSARETQKSCERQHGRDGE